MSQRGQKRARTQAVSPMRGHSEMQSERLWQLHTRGSASYSSDYCILNLKCREVDNQRRSAMSITMLHGQC